MRQDKTGKRVALCGIFLSLSLVVSLLESVIPIQAIVPLPGIKLGLANIVIIFVLFRIGAFEAAAISLCRVVLSSLLFGSATTFFFSLFGAALSFIAAFLIKRFAGKYFSYMGICVICAALHNVGQIAAACITLCSTAPLQYLPLLMLASLVTGTITGLILLFTEPKIKL